MFFSRKYKNKKQFKLPITFLSVPDYMSKTNLKKYTKELSKEQLEEQIILLYDKFPAVKTFYDFVFHPNEKKLASEARIKIAQEYYPNSTRKPKLRRSIAQKILKHFIGLGVDSFIIADLQLFSIEIAQSYTAEKPIKQEAFYKSMLLATHQALAFILEHGILYEYKERLFKICSTATEQNWPNAFDFDSIMERIN
jgi:hypothetical protein